MRLAIIGHRQFEEILHSEAKVNFQFKLRKYLAYLELKEELVLISTGESGVGSWVADYAIKNKIPYELYLACSPTTQHSDEYINVLTKYQEHAKYISLNYSGLIKSAYKARNQIIVKKCDYIIGYYNRKNSLSAKCIRYYCMQNRIKAPYNLYTEKTCKFKNPKKSKKKVFALN